MAPAVLVHGTPAGQPRQVVLDLGSGAGTALPDLPLLHGLFDVTPREAQLCAALAVGRSLKAAAALLGMRLSTARAHLDHIFSKTGTHRQAELVLLLQSAQPLGRPAALG